MKGNENLIALAQDAWRARLSDQNEKLPVTVCGDGGRRNEYAAALLAPRHLSRRPGPGVTVRVRGRPLAIRLAARHYARHGRELL